MISFKVYDVGPEQQLVQDPVPSAPRLVSEGGFPVWLVAAVLAPALCVSCYFL